MYVIRPRNTRSTPSAVAHDLGTQTRFYPNTRRPRSFDYNRDFFMVPVQPQHVLHAPPEYGDLYAFQTKNKYGQRALLQKGGIPVPAMAATSEGTAALRGEQFVVRPLRHARGIGYRVTQDRLDFSPGEEYISELYPKRREYRVIFVFGKPLIWLRKKPNEGVDYTQPWGHENSFFQTINDHGSSRLARTTCLPTLCTNHIISNAHIVAADILYNNRADQPYVVLELNFCPSLQIDNNREQVVEAIRARL